jgi:23S rRNA G2445 N2-methylase RlmL
MLRYAGWAPGTTLLDPFCGSGTIVIEAAMMAAGRAPGDIRERFAYAAWPWFRPEKPERRTSHSSPDDRASNDRTAGETGALIVGRDTDSTVLGIAARNAARAGVDHLIRFEQADARTEASPDDSGIIVTNPPYGERLALDEARSFYRELGQHLKASYAGWSCYLLSANREAMKGVGLRASSRRQLWNGGLDARLYAFEIFPPREDRPASS